MTAPKLEIIFKEWDDNEVEDLNQGILAAQLDTQQHELETEHNEETTTDRDEIDEWLSQARRELDEDEQQDDSNDDRVQYETEDEIDNVSQIEELTLSDHSSKQDDPNTKPKPHIFIE